MLLGTDKDTAAAFGGMLEGYDCPAILVSADYRILATNRAYRTAFGKLEASATHYCYRVSHGYDQPCDRAGESCPLAAASVSGQRERVLHIHQTPRGEEHVDVDMLPVFDAGHRLQFFVELLKPVPVLRSSGGDLEMAGRGEAFNRMLSRIARVGPTDAAVLLLGESGTGKELAARAIHQASPRKGGAMVTLECSGLTDTLFESELFGHVRGAFTGAHSTRKGLVESADGGTLFLDEIGDVPLALQVKLLRLLESGTFRPVGSAEVRRSNFRLVCATHRNLRQLVDSGQFRSDLYYRINVFPIHLASLAERREDIPLLARSLLQRLGRGTGYHLTESAQALLCAQPFPGNIRELRNILQRALVLAPANVIDVHVLEEALEDDSAGYGAVPPGGRDGRWVDLKTAEMNYLRELMAAFDNDKARVAAVAGISLRSLYRKLKGAPP